MRAKIISAAILFAFLPLLANASDTSPYVVGQWNFQDSFKDFEGDSEPPVVTQDTVFTFLNPTQLRLTLDYAFFAEDGTFCGCDEDTLEPNGRVRYTMLAEAQEGFLSRELCPTQTDGEMKSIVFESEKSIGKDWALETGLQIHIANGKERTESDLKAVTVNRGTIREMRNIHAQCKNFLMNKKQSSFM
ncbi:MAG: hypothetical protein ABIQ95_06465 [Bdellovibrionia bacterium]